MRPPRTYTTEAIILKHSDFGEADRILTVLTPHKGKIRVIAKGVRRPVSRKAGHLELLCHSQLQMAQGRNLDIVTQASSIEGFLHMRSEKELWHRTCSFYFAELVDRFIEDETEHTDVYELLLEALHCLNADVQALQQQREQQTWQSDRARDRSLLLMRYFEIYLLSCIGYEPLLRTCAHCHTELQPEENGFTPALGGAVCPQCSHLWAQPLSLNALKVLRLLQRTEWERVPQFHLDARLHGEIEAAMHGLLRFHLERDLKTWNFLDMLSYN
jgi:DNA repair protein RecO (recombination protein O)